MTLNKIVYDIREKLKQYTDDNELDNRYIVYLLNIKRAKYLRQELNNYQRTTDVSVTQTLCLELEEVSANQCGLTYECDTIYRTKKPIPQPLELHIKSALTNVRPTNRTDIPFNFVTKEKAVYSKNSPFNKGIYCFLDNDRHLYLVSMSETMKLIDCLTVTGVFENPLDLLNYKTCCGCTDALPCYDEDVTNYPLQPQYIDLIVAEIVNELGKYTVFNEDSVNNSADDKE